MLRTRGVGLGHRMRTVRAVTVDWACVRQLPLTLGKEGKSPASPPYRGWGTNLTFKTPSCSKSTSDREFFNVVPFLLSLAKKHFRKSSAWATKKKLFLITKKVSKQLRLKSKCHLKVRWNAMFGGQWFLLTSFLKPDKGHSSWCCDKANREPRLVNWPSSVHMRHHHSYDWEPLSPSILFVLSRGLRLLFSPVKHACACLPVASEA